ncbi:MAG: SEC-C metal-binding domain-containing protein [bacterium]
MIKPIELVDKEFADQIKNVVNNKNIVIMNTRVFKKIGPNLQEILLEKPNRNDPCICGSDKKFKKCCGK